MKRKDVFTTGQVAQICNVAPRTVTKWFDSGQLKGYRIPGSKDRRIPVTELLRFMKANSIPTDGLDLGKLKLLIVDTDEEFGSSIADLISKNPKYLVKFTANPFDAGLLAQKLVPHVILINLMSENINAVKICQAVHCNSDLNGIKVVAMANNIGDKEIQAVLSRGFDGCVNNTTDVGTIIRTVEEATRIVY